MFRFTLGYSLTFEQHIASFSSFYHAAALTLIDILIDSISDAPLIRISFYVIFYKILID